jgi:hypothetical protein
MEQEKKASRLYTGNAPDSEWECVEIFPFENVEWHLYLRDEVKEGWYSYKLVSSGRVVNKANYWFGWNGGRANNSRDWWRLGLNRPDLHASVLAFLKQET